LIAREAETVSQLVPGRQVNQAREGREITEGGTKMAIDPVCKMEVEESQAAATSEYKGKTYYFCAVGCKKAFDGNPEKYLAE